MSKNKVLKTLELRSAEQMVYWEMTERLVGLKKEVLLIRADLMKMEPGIRLPIRKIIANVLSMISEYERRSIVFKNNPLPGNLKQCRDQYDQIMSGFDVLQTMLSMGTLLL